jgi:Coenzyme PQQ synthesis protein D (PqqD)
MAQLLPTARESGLAIEHVDDGLLVYDLDRNKGYCLNHTAALVWNHCNGRTSAAQIAKRLKKKTGARVDEKVVWYALDQLGRDGLLEQRLPLPASLAGMTRRQHLRALGKVAAIAVPVVTAVMAPTASAAGSGVAPGGSCTSNGPGNNCSSKHCCNTNTPAGCICVDNCGTQCNQNAGSNCNGVGC